jgi:hypothetical protein
MRTQSPEPPPPPGRFTDLDVRVIHATTGEILRHLNLDPTRRYH